MPFESSASNAASSSSSSSSPATVCGSGLPAVSVFAVEDDDDAGAGLRPGFTFDVGALDFVLAGAVKEERTSFQNDGASSSVCALSISGPHRP